MRKILCLFLLCLFMLPVSGSYAQDIFAHNSHEILEMLLKTDGNGGDIPGKAYLKIEFDVNSAKIKQAGIPLVNELVTAMKSPRGAAMKVLLRGHTDSDGSRAANKRLSLHRAEAVRTYMVKNGISKDRIKVEGCGEDEPLVPNSSAAAKARNRRVEVVNITEGSDATVPNPGYTEEPVTEPVENFKF
ncbi:OmpA family protein [Maridesulfovibrio bastinii]|uniref:OmpA family protein n=1 Tax=Maridesulfovibrio bastinii TaxID=47157 RepID=UPI000425CA0B|nr:OmpA family protein [Maridesulfovibrio bastinii]